MISSMASFRAPDPQKDQKSIYIDFWSFWGSGARKEAIEEIIEDFNQSQDEIHVNYKYQPWGDIWTKSLSAITAVL